jgi:hypothetical protein
MTYIKYIIYNIYIHLYYIHVHVHLYLMKVHTQQYLQVGTCTVYRYTVQCMWCVPVRLIVNVPFSLLLDLHQVKPSHRSLRVKYLYQSRKYLVVPRPIHHTWYRVPVPVPCTGTSNLPARGIHVLPGTVRV